MIRYERRNRTLAIDREAMWDGKPMSETTLYDSAVRGRREFRAAYREKLRENRRLRDALDRIARFGEAYDAATKRLGHDGLNAGPALAVTLGNYAREAARACKIRI